MTAKSTATVHVPSAPELVHRALWDREYWEYETARFFSAPGKLISFDSATDDEVTVTFSESLPNDMLPGPVRRIVSRTLPVQRTVSFRQLPDGTVSGTMKGRISDLPVTFSAEFTVVAESAGTSTELHVATTIDVKIPMAGALVEPKSVDLVRQMVETEGKLLKSWLTDTTC